VRDEAARCPDLGGEEVSCRDRLRMRLQERAPARGSIWARRQTCVLQRLRDGGAGDAVVELLQFALDAQVSPTRVVLAIRRMISRIAAMSPGRPTRPRRG